LRGINAHRSLSLPAQKTPDKLFDSNPYQMNAIPNRIVIYAKDIVNITGCSLRTAQRILALIRKKSNKDKHSFISVQEFCSFSGLSEDKVYAFLA
jgi:hypothetical protein